MVKLLGIVGSPNKDGSTAFLVKKALAGASMVEGVKTMTIFLSDFVILDCDGCNRCIKEKKCPKVDDMEKIAEELKSANGFIFGAPSYFYSVPGLVKKFIDRTRPLKMAGHLLQDKVFSVITTSGLRSGGQELIATELIWFALTHGMIIVGNSSDPLALAAFPTGTLQGEEKWRSIKKDNLAVTSAIELGKRVANFAKKNQ